MANTESKYKAMKTRVEILKDQGFNYEGRILLRTTDNNLYKNDNIRGFALKLEPILQTWFRMTKQIKAWSNYAVDKDTNRIN